MATFIQPGFQLYSPSLLAETEPEGYGTLPAALDPELFLSWPESYQKSYVLARQVGTPPLLTIGVIGSGSLVASVAGTPAALALRREPPEYASAPGDLSGASFEGWDPVYQKAYVLANRASATAPLLIGQLGVGSVMALLGTTLTVTPEPAGVGNSPPTLSPSAFAAWPAAYRTAYFDAQQTALPFLIGTLGQGSVMATRVAGVVTTTAEPTGAGTAPAALTRTVFEAWSADFKAAYVLRHGSGTPPALLLGIFNGTPASYLATYAAAGVTLTAQPAATTTLPPMQTRALFAAMPLAFQHAYIESYSSGQPKTVLLGNAGNTVAVRREGDAVTFTTEPAGYDLSSAAVAPADFLTWPEAFQTAFLARQTSQPVMLGTPGNGSMLATLASGRISYMSEPLGFSSAPANVPGDDFLTWPPAYKTAYVTANTTGGYVRTLLVGRMGERSLQVVVPAAGSPASVTMEPTGASLDPKSLTRSAFDGWSEFWRIAYVAEHGVGNPKGVVIGLIGSTAKAMLVKLNDSGTEVSRTAEPSAADTAPASLALATFSLWDPYFQVAYVERYGVGTPKHLILLDGSARLSLDGLSVTRNVKPATYPPTGTTVPEATFVTWPAAYQEEWLRLHPPTSVTGTFWDKQIPRPQYAPVIVPTPGEASTVSIPYLILPGSDIGLVSPDLLSDARELFTVFDGTAGKKMSEQPGVALPAAFSQNVATLTGDDLDTFLKSFLGWHSALQVEYVRSHATSAAGVVPIQMKVPSSATTADAIKLTAVVSQENASRVIIVEQLQKADFSTLDPRDQAAVAGTLAFQLNIGSKLGLAGATSKSALKDQVNEIIAEINARTTSFNFFGMSAAHKKIFTDQLTNLNNQIDKMAVFSPSNIKEKYEAIQTRFKRAFEFYDVKADYDSGSIKSYMKDDNDDWEVYYMHVIRGAISLDQNATINRGYQTFIQQEERYLNLENARLLAADTGKLMDKSLDVPSLIYYFQSQYNLAVECLVVMETEEVNQMNSLLKTYARMQDLVNQTIKTFGTDTEDENALLDAGDRGLYITLMDGGKTPAQLTAEQRARLAVVSMFEDNEGNYQTHPLERLRNITRPEHEMFEQKSPTDNDDWHDWHYKLSPDRKDQWDRFATQISETVTLLNQESQIKMNDINSMDKQRNRHYDLATGALSKMFDMISNIARSG